MSVDTILDMRLVESTWISLDGMVFAENFWGAHGRFLHDTHIEYAAKSMGSIDAHVPARATTRPVNNIEKGE